MISIFYGPTIYKPGSSLKSVAIKQLQRNDVLYIFSKPSNKAINYLIAPLLTDENDYEIFSNQVTKYIKSKNLKIKSIYLGISSPKQNLLANHISKSLNYCDIYCIGAVLDDIIENDSQDYRKGTEWILRSIKKPRRSLHKLNLYFISLLKILISDRLMLSNFYNRKLKI